MTHNSTVNTAFPLRTQHFTCDVDDSFTDFLLCAYTDFVMITVTQTESLGTIFQSRVDTNLDGAAAFNIRVLVGNRSDSVLMLCARQLAEGILAAGCTKPLMLCLGLKSLSMTSIRQVIQHVVQHPVW